MEPGAARDGEIRVSRATPKSAAESDAGCRRTSASKCKQVMVELTISFHPSGSMIRAELLRPRIWDELSSCGEGSPCSQLGQKGVNDWAGFVDGRKSKKTDNKIRFDF